jgi:hypothetical protein
MPSEKLPAAVWSGTFKLFGVTVRCYQLDNGQRIIDASDMHTLLRAMGGYRLANSDNDNEQMAAFNRWRLGK